MSLGMNLRMSAVMVAGVVCMMPDVALAQCDVLLQESFRFGPRPHGGNGRERDAQLEDRLHDYWPQVSSIGARWISADQAPMPLWQFSWSNEDPVEVDPLEGPFGSGTAYGEPGAATMIAFGAPATAFTMSADLGLGGGTAYLGYTTTTAFVNNFEQDGTLWISINADGDWTIRANGSEVVASGHSSGGGALNGAYYRVELTFDPATSQASCNVSGYAFGPFPVTLTRPLAYFGMEMRDVGSTVNNLLIYTGAALTVSVSEPNPVCEGDTLTLHATSNAAEPARYYWSAVTGFDPSPMSDGVLPSGTVVSGANTANITFTNIKAEDFATYQCIVVNACGLKTSTGVTLRRCIADTDCNGSVTSQDFFNFLGAFFGGAESADVNNDGSVTSQDLFDFLSVFFSGCD